MFRIPLTHTKSRRDLAGSLRNSRPRKHARLRRRRLQAERLEDRQLLATISGQVFNDLDSDGLKDADGNGPHSHSLGRRPPSTKKAQRTR